MISENHHHLKSVSSNTSEFAFVSAANMNNIFSSNKIDMSGQTKFQNASIDNEPPRDTTISGDNNNLTTTLESARRNSSKRKSKNSNNNVSNFSKHHGVPLGKSPSGSGVNKRQTRQVNSTKIALKKQQLVEDKKVLEKHQPSEPTLQY